MMTHYTLLQYAMPREYVLPFIAACNTHLEYFITADDLLGHEDIHPLPEINEIFDLNSEEFKTIAILINPYKRMVLFYKNRTNPVIDAQFKLGPDYVDYTVCKTFSEFLNLYLNPSNPNYSTMNALTAAPFFSGTLQVNYQLDFDNFNTDVRSIPEFANLTDVDFLAQAHAACADYKELYTDADKAKVAEVFAVDIAKWNYTFE
jgi:hypothetical protein